MFFQLPFFYSLRTLSTPNKTYRIRMRSRGSPKRSNPANIRMPIMKSGRHGLHQHGERPPVLDSACLPEAQDAFHPAVATFTGGAKAALAPDHRKPKHSFCMVVRRRQHRILAGTATDAPSPASGDAPACRRRPCDRHRSRAFA